MIKLGGYAVNTVGEDMELVMRIRQYAAESKEQFKIGYTRKAVCYTQLPWRISDYIKQRIRWTVGLTDVLWKYRDMAISKLYSAYERIAFWYYVIIEKFSPHIEFIVFIICILLKLPGMVLWFVILVFLIQTIIASIGSYKSIRKLIRTSDNILKTIARLITLLFLFVTVYHVFHSIVRLISVPFSKLSEIRKSNKAKAAWNSPKRL